MKHMIPLSALALLLASFSAPAADWTVLSGDVSGVASRSEAVIRTPEEWAALWREHDAGRGQALPDADFTKEMIVAVWGAPGRRFVMRKIPAAAPAVAFTGGLVAPAAPRGENEALRGWKDLPALSGSAFDGSAAAAPSAAEPKKENGWAVVLRFGPTFTDYFDADIKLQTARVQGVVKNAMIGERNDMHWYSRAGMKDRPFHFIDEPSNDFTIGLENRKKGYAVNFNGRHPKFLIVERDSINQNVRFTGTIDRASVDRDLPANKLFDRYRLTHRLMNYQLQLEKLCTVAEGKAGRLVVAPGIAAGAYFGYANAGYADGSTGATSSSSGYLGKGISGSGRVSYELHRVSASLAYQLTKAAMDYPFIDGTAAHRLDNRTVTLQVGLTLKK